MLMFQPLIDEEGRAYMQAYGKTCVSSAVVPLLCLHMYTLTEHTSKEMRVILLPLHSLSKTVS